MRAGAVVVGGGVMGVAIAWQLAERLHSLTEPVVLLEKSALAAGSSGRSGAILRQFYSHRELVGMARDSLRVFAGFEAHTGRALGFQACGVLTLGRLPDERELVLANVALMRELGVTVELVEAREMRRLVPGIVLEEDALGAWEPHGGFVDPKRTVAAFAEIAKSRGAIVRTGLGAESLVVEGEQVRGVRTREGEIRSQRVILATGAWSSRLLAPLGLEPPLRAIKPDQHFLATPAVPSDGPRRPGPSAPSAARLLEHELDDRFAAPEEPPAAHAVLLDLERRFYARCEPEGRRTRIGGMDLSRDPEVPDPDQLDEEVGEEFRRWARGALESRLSPYAGQPDAGSLAGLYTMTPDGQALIGEAGPRGLLLVAGFSGHGFKLAPSIGEGVAQLVLGEPVSAFEPAFFAPERFAKGGAVLGRGFGL